MPRPASGPGEEFCQNTNAQSLITGGITMPLANESIISLIRHWGRTSPGFGLKNNSSLPIYLSFTYRKPNHKEHLSHCNSRIQHRDPNRKYGVCVLYWESPSILLGGDCGVFLRSLLSLV